jgi:hypothetical protein
MNGALGSRQHEEPVQRPWDGRNHKIGEELIFTLLETVDTASTLLKMQNVTSHLGPTGSEPHWVRLPSDLYVQESLSSSIVNWPAFRTSQCPVLSIVVLSLPPPLSPTQKNVKSYPSDLKHLRDSLLKPLRTWTVTGLKAVALTHTVSPKLLGPLFLGCFLFSSLRSGSASIVIHSLLGEECLNVIQ